MTREQRRDIFEAVGLIAIVASLIFLALEVRQANLATRIAARDFASQGHIEFLGRLIDSGIVAVARQKAIDGEELTTLESGQLGRFHDQRWRHYERVFYLYQFGVISDQEWVAYENGILRAFKRSSTYWEISRITWQGGKALYSEQFVDYVEALTGN